MHKERYVRVVAALLLLLFLYTALSKLLEYDVFLGQLRAQPLAGWLTEALALGLVPAELLCCGLLFFERTRRYGFYLSALLMALFSGYVALALLGVFGKVPCSCGGVLRGMGWGIHLVFNLFFLGLALTGIFLTSKERRYARHLNT